MSPQNTHGHHGRLFSFVGEERWSNIQRDIGENQRGIEENRKSIKVLRVVNDEELKNELLNMNMGTLVGLEDILDADIKDANTDKRNKALRLIINQNLH